MFKFAAAVILVACFATLAGAEGLQALRNHVSRSFAQFNNVSITDRLDDVGGGIVIAGHFNGSELINHQWLILWDIDTDELEIRKNGSKIADLDQYTLTASVEFEGAYDSQSAPQVSGTITTDSSDHLFIQVSDPDGGFMLELDADGDLVDAKRCLCTFPNGTVPTATCTNRECDQTEQCTPSGKWCNWRAVTFQRSFM